MLEKFFPTQSALRDILVQRMPYSVPKFQREYSWKSDKVEAFWDDLLTNDIKAQKSPGDPDNQYYFGGMVLLSEEPRTHIVIVDGQQRIATVTIFLCVIRDILHKMIKKFPQEATAALTTVSEHIQVNKDDGTFDYYKIELNERNKDFFRINIQTPGDPETKISSMPKGKFSSERFLGDAYKFLYEKIGKYKEEFSESEQPAKLRALANRMLEWFSVIAIQVRTEEDAFDIFETLNERGERLIIGDLVKNSLMKNVSKKNRDHLDANWGRIMEYVGGENKRIDNFLTHSWYSRRFFKDGKLSKNNLFKVIKKQSGDEKSVIEYVDNLLEDAEIYEAIINPEEAKSFWNNDEDIIHYLSSLNLLGAERTIPCLLAAYRKFESERQKFLLICSSLLSFFFRFKSVADESAEAVLKHMVEMSSYISGQDPTDNYKECSNWEPDEIKSYLKNKICSNDDTFSDEFGKWQTDSAKIAKYVLYEIENIISQKRKEELKPVAGLTLEHIIPKEFDDWTNYLKEKGITDVEPLISRLGNMTILTQKMNSKIKNELFNVKKDKAYRESKLELNIQTVMTSTEWSKKEIDDRQEMFAKYAIKIWDF